MVDALRRSSILVLALLATASLATAQTLAQATVTGTVREGSGAPLPGVTVTATRTGGAPAVAVTEANGEFRLTGLVPGAYVLDAQLEGFQKVSKEVKLTANQILQIAFTIVPAFGETVEVVAKAAKTGEVAVLESRREAPVVS